MVRACPGVLQLLHSSMLLDKQFTGRLLLKFHSSGSLRVSPFPSKAWRSGNTQVPDARMGPYMSPIEFRSIQPSPGRSYETAAPQAVCRHRCPSEALLLLVAAFNKEDASLPRFIPYGASGTRLVAVAHFMFSC